MSNWLANLFGGQKESATIRAARASGGNLSGYTMAVDLLDDAINMAAQKSGVKFKPGSREKIRAAIRESISPEGTDKLVLQQTLMQVLQQAGFMGMPMPQPQVAQAMPFNNVPAGYMLVPTNNPMPVAQATPSVQFGWDSEDLRQTTAPSAAPSVQDTPV